MKFLICLWASLLVAHSVQAFEFKEKDRAQANRLVRESMDRQTAYDLVESLTTEIGPRLAGSKAEARARDWAVREFKRLELRNVRVEPFTVPLWQRHIERASVTSPFPQDLTVTALGGSVSTPAGGVEGEVVRFDSLSALQAAKDGALKGKIAFVDEVMSRTQDGSGYGVAVGKRSQAAFEGHRLGAAAVLIRSVGTSKHRFAHTGQMKRLSEGDPGPSVPAAALASPDANQLTRMLARGKPVEVKVELKTEVRPEAPSGNVIAEIPGTSRKDEIVLLGAHLDSWDLGTGAVDDGAGVGIVMAAAELILKEVKKKPLRTIRIVLFGSEEVGLVGAKAYTDKHRDQLGQHIVAMESDFGADAVWRYSAGNIAESKQDVIKATQKILRPLQVNPGNFQGNGGPDLFYMQQAGVPVLDLRQNGLDYFDLHHTPNDTLNKIEPSQLRQNVAVYAALAYLFAYTDVSLRD